MGRLPAPSAPTKSSAHSWAFKARFRRHAFGWKSQPAITRIRQAVAEIQKVAKKDPVLAAEGAVALLERVSPAIEQVDGSSGSRPSRNSEGFSGPGSSPHRLPLGYTPPVDGPRRFAAFQRLGRLQLVLTFLLGFSLIASAQPCPDDFLVATGQSSDGCAAGVPSDAAPAEAGSSVCPCTCHMGVVILAAPSSQPARLEVEPAVSPGRAPVDFRSSPATPPPRS